MGELRAALGCWGLTAAELIGVPIVSLLLRSSVRLTNRCLVPPDGDEWDARERYRRRVPVPSLVGGMVLVLVVQVLGFVTTCVGGFGLNVALKGAGLIPDNLGPWAVRALGLAIGFPVWATVLVIALPTSFGRAALATAFLYLHLVLFALVLSVPIILLVLALDG
jgi:hypothetical protein